MERLGLKFAKLALLALALSCALPLGGEAAPRGGGASRGGSAGFTINPGVNRMKLDPQPDYERTMKEGGEKKGASVKCTSGYRTPGEQRAACMRICGRDRCPNKCAPPGGSNHQKVATCDLQGIPGSAQAGCDYLFEMCQQMRSRDRSLQCEIGGYGPGAHHLAVGKGIRPSAYNQCKHLKSKMGMDPGRDQRLQNDADKLEKEIMGNPQQQPQQAGGMPQMPQMPQAPQSSSGEGAPPGGASYPSPIQSGATSPTPDSPREASNSVGSRGSNGKSGSPITIDIKPGFGKDNSDVTKSGLGGADPSGITGGPNNSANIGVAGGVLPPDGSGRDFSGASKPVAASGGFGSGGGGAGGGGSTSSGGAKGAGAAGGAAGADGAGYSGGVDLLGSFSGGGGGGGKLSSPKVSVQGSEVDAAVKSLAEEFQADGAERDPASEEAADSEGAEAGNLFERMHEAHERCLRRGCVSRAR